MRVAVLVFAMLGTITTGFLGVKWYSDLSRLEPFIELQLGLEEAMSPAKGEQKRREYNELRNATYFLLAGVPLGVFAAIVGYLGRGKSSAVLLLLVPLGPAVFRVQTLVFTGLCLIAALLALTMKLPKPRVVGLHGDDG
jgi:hypothetical protein